MKKKIYLFLSQKAIAITAILFLAAAHSFSQAKKGYAPANGIKLYYEVYGEGKPVVLLHGAYMTINLNWSSLIPELAKTRKVIALEMQGHGHTELSGRPFSYSTMANDIAGVLKFLKIESADFIGYSFGGTITYQLLLNHPALVGKAVIISSTYKYTGWQKEVRDVLHSMQPEFLSGTPLKSEYNAVAPDSSQWNSFLSKMIEFDKQDFDLGEDKIKNIKSPVLIISGDNDGIDKEVLFKTYRLLGGCTFADMTGIPKSQLAIIPGQGHVSVMMQTDAILGMVNKFLQ
jgi:pimeloyl-ACP methyl ester carboxylesterase